MAATLLLMTAVLVLAQFLSLLFLLTVQHTAPYRAVSHDPLVLPMSSELFCSQSVGGALNIKASLFLCCNIIYVTVLGADGDFGNLFLKGSMQL